MCVDYDSIAAMIRCKNVLLIGFVLVAISASLWAAPLEKREAMIPMRDGAGLYTEIWRDPASHERLPFLIVRTPYGAARQPGSIDRSQAELVAEGYIFVYQDIRGRYKSEGQFVMARPPRDRKSAAGIDEGTDTYDT